MLDTQYSILITRNFFTMYKIFSFFLIALFSFAVPQNLAKKIAGKYGKMDRENGEYICLQLFDNEEFTMSISSCDRDRYINGKYSFDGAAVYLTSDIQPDIKINQIDSSESEEKGRKLSFISSDVPLLQQIEVELNDSGKWQSLNPSQQIFNKNNIEKIRIKLGDLTAEHTIAFPEKNNILQLDFQHISEMTMTEQKWNYSRKKLILTDDSGAQITLKKGRKCWLDYEFE